MINSHLRPALARAMSPVGRGMARVGISPDVVTALGTLGVAAGALAFYPRGQLFVGTLVCTGFVLADMLDGAVARATGSSSAWGAFLDSTLDRIADTAILGGLLLWFAGGGRDAVLAGLTLFCMIAGVVVPYAKARAESLGFTCELGLAQRGERVFVALVAAGLAGLGVPYALPVGLWVLAAASAITVIQRLVAVHRTMREGDPAVWGKRRDDGQRAEGEAP